MNLSVTIKVFILVFIPSAYLIHWIEFESILCLSSLGSSSFLDIPCKCDLVIIFLITITLHALDAIQFIFIILIFTSFVDLYHHCMIHLVSLNLLN